MAFGKTKTKIYLKDCKQLSAYFYPIDMYILKKNQSKFQKKKIKFFC